MTQVRPRLIQFLGQVSSAARRPAGRSARNRPHRFCASCNPAAHGRYGTPAAGCTPAAAPAPHRTLHLQPPRPGRLARHRHQRKPLRPCLPDRPVSASPHPERLHPHRLTRQHPHIMINHRDRLLVLRQVNPDHRAITRQHRPQPLPPRVPRRSPRVMPLPLYRTSSLVAPGHQARTIAPGGRPRLNHIPQNRRLPGVVLLLRGNRPAVAPSPGHAWSPGDGLIRAARVGRLQFRARDADRAARHRKSRLGIPADPR